MKLRVASVAIPVLFYSLAAANDPVPPTQLIHQLMTTSGQDLTLSWDPATTDQLGAPESLAGYRVYRGNAPDFVADKDAGTNRVGSPPTAAFTDTGAAEAAQDYFYLISAVDTAGNEGNTRPSKVTSGPTGFIANMSRDMASFYWTGALPASMVAGYKVYWGAAPNAYTNSKVFSNTNAGLITGLQPCTQYYFGITAFDSEQNSTTFGSTSGSTKCGDPNPTPQPEPVTAVCGQISSNTTWTKAGGPYVVACDVHVSGTTLNPATLTIEPGTEVRFEANRYLIIGDYDNLKPGALVANGTAANPIVFTANSGGQAPGFWGGVEILNSSPASATSLDHLTIAYAGSELDPTNVDPQNPYFSSYWAAMVIDSTGATVGTVTVADALDDCTFIDDTSGAAHGWNISRCGTSGLVVGHFVSSVHDNSISQVGDDAILPSSDPAQEASIVNNTINDVGGAGIRLRDPHSGTVVQSNAIGSCAESSIVVENNNPGRSVTIENNQLDSGFVFDNYNGTHIVRNNSIGSGSSSKLIGQIEAPFVADVLDQNTFLVQPGATFKVLMGLSSSPKLCRMNRGN